MKDIKFYIAIVLLLGGLTFVSCNEDDDKGYGDKVAIANLELKNFLIKEGYTFTSDGLLVRDYKVKNTQSFNLSGVKVKDLSELKFFPNLREVNLSKNELGPVFDFSLLPEKIKSVDLTGNEIYAYKGLVNVSIEENGEEIVTILRSLQKLVLPQAAKYNMDEILPYYRQNQKVIKEGRLELKMENKNKVVEDYTTLREIPDELFRGYLKKQFPNLFKGDLLDIDKRLSLSEETVAISIYPFIYDPDTDPVDITKIKDASGVEYFINNLQYKGAIELKLNKDQECSLGYLKVGPHVKSLNLYYINTPLMDLSAAERLSCVELMHNKDINKLNLSDSKTFLSRTANDMSVSNRAVLHLVDCPQLKEVKLPAIDSPKAVTSIHLINLPLLKSFDLYKHFNSLWELHLASLPSCELTYPTITAWFSDWHQDEKEGKLEFSIDENVYSKSATKEFIKKYLPLKRLTSWSSLNDAKPYNYTK